MEVVPIPEFPEYGVTTEGDIVNLHTNRRLKVSYTKEGTPKVGFCVNGKQHWRSVTRIVAEAFVEPDNEFCTIPMPIDCDNTNHRASNIVWRPRWYIMEYRQEYVLPHAWFNRGPLFNITTNTRYETLGEFCRSKGLLITRTGIDIHNHQKVWPTREEVMFL